jgi:uncharacterized protein YjbI with pentapeptide repeats
VLSLPPSVRLFVATQPIDARSEYAGLMLPKTLRELVDCYQRGDRSFPGAELDDDPKGDLSGLTLDGIDLSHSVVVASFTSSSLRGAKFRNANVKTCDFCGCDLRDADFSGAALDATSFIGARLEGARFEGATAYSHTLKHGEQPDW